MNLFLTSTYYPSDFETVEQQTVFNLESLIKGIYSEANNLTFPHSFTESEAVYAAPVIQKRITPTPEGGMRMVYQVAFLISPGAGFDASGIWNHALPIAPNLVLPS